MSWWGMGVTPQAMGVGRVSSVRTRRCSHRREAVRVGETGEIPEDDGGGNELGVLPA